MARRARNEGPWMCVADSGRIIARRRSRRAAIRYFERPYWAGAVKVQHIRTGEIWHRRGGSWFQADAGEPAPKPAPNRTAGGTA